MTHRGSLDGTRASLTRGWWLVAPALLLACSESSGGANGGDAAAPDADVSPPPDTAPMDAPPPDAPPQDAPPPDADPPEAAACPAGQARCGAACVDLQADGSHCGACDVACPSGERCAAGRCDVVCAADQAVCTAMTGGQARRYCATLAADVANCGACGSACAAGSSCVMGACRLVCAAGQEPCGAACRDLQADVAHCGACDRACGTPANATARCVAGRCAPDCAAGFGDCDGDAANGCEVDTRAAAAHCGACGRGCAPANAVAACAGGVCGVGACATGFGDCDGDAANGCEVDTRVTAAHCGMCGRGCSLPNATATCAGGACRVERCAAGFGDCDGDAANGCEVSLAGANAHCGACGAACAAGRVCAMGLCTLSCPAGQAVCGDGCFDLAASAAHCGRCDNACRAPGGVAGCAAGACTVASCAAGFGDCDGMVANGCEVDTATSLTHCGRCGSTCALANATPACRGGVCDVASCAAGFGDCDGAAGNGCEVDTRASDRHCGACGRACADGEACRAGACVAVPQGTSCRAVLAGRPGAPSGLYLVDPDGDGALAPQRVYCDMARDGGGWTLLEVGRALGTSLWTRNAVGAVTDPGQPTSAKLARDFAAAVLLAGARTLRVGDEGRYGELYLGPLDEAWIRSGLGATAFGTVVVGRRVAETLGGAQYDGSRFAWPLDGPPAACLNSDGSTSECGGGLHLGTWNHLFSYRGDEIYVNYSSRCCNLATNNGYRVWAR